MFGPKEPNFERMYTGEDMLSWQRKVYAAKNPCACARFFDVMITTFIKVILGHGKDCPGLYGQCDAYYSVVEAQGKGTLHLHMLVWLHGHLSPQALRDKLSTSEEYRNCFVEWLESIIMNEFPSVSQRPEDDPIRNRRVRCKELGEPHPGTMQGPSLLHGHTSMNDFWAEYNEYLIRLLNEYNWHEHTGTCWKYLKLGDEKSDRNCRMRMDGSISPQTVIDQETGHFQLQRLHPWISSYTDVVTFLMKCNMNIQFIGMGTEAKAFIYYVTDYIAKPSLPAHAGLAALSYAIKKINEQAKDYEDTSPSFCSNALTKFVNSMMGKQEISHQQVMSYLVGGGDCYTSERFHNLHLGAFLRYLSVNMEPTYDATEPGEHRNGSANAEDDEAVYLTIDEDGARKNNQVLDYRFRPLSEPYNSMCLYDFVAYTTKTKQKNKDALEDSLDSFSSWDHPQRRTHKISRRSKAVLPVILGPSLPSRSASGGTGDIWAKYMLALFKPWREPCDLKGSGQSWIDASQTFKEHNMPKRHRKILHNMELLSECADARFMVQKHAHAIPQEYLSAEHTDESDKVDCDRPLTCEEDVQQWKAKYCSDVFLGFDERSEGSKEHYKAHSNNSYALLKDTLGKQVVDTLELCLHNPEDNNSPGLRENMETSFMELDTNAVAVHNAIMQKKRKRAIMTEEDPENTRVSKKQHTEPFVDINTIPLYAVGDKGKYCHAVDEIVKEMNLATNEKQLDAFLSVAQHMGERDPDQLLMFVSGVGGTGKSHVIKSIVKLFERTNRRQSILLGAPTGSAAILIGGSTLHSLILENPNVKGRKNTSILSRMWKGVNYLIVDEVSMLSAKFLSKLSDAMKQAKGDDPIKAAQIFGGVNVIFMGDFCQLKPPAQRALFAAQIVKKLMNESANEEDVSCMNGVFLWRQVTKVVELVINCRHASDLIYSEFLSRLRVASCVNANSDPRGFDDYRYLQSHLLTNIQRDNPEELSSFRDAPFIVGSKLLRDMLNARLALFHASRMEKDLHIYYSKDFCKRKIVPAGSAEYLWNLHSSYVRDSLGRLPLFEGMKVMVTENIAFDNKIVNGTEGIVRNIIYEEDEDGKRYPTMVYLYIEGISFKIDGLEDDMVPIFPVRTRIEHSRLDVIGLQGRSFTRLQLPLLPAYMYTDFKSQGRTLPKAIVDIVTARCQGVYVMLSRVTSLSGIAILRLFPQSKIYHRLPEELREELTHLHLRL